MILICRLLKSQVHRKKQKSRENAKMLVSGTNSHKISLWRPTIYHGDDNQN